MKNLIYSLSLAMACGFAANAAGAGMTVQKMAQPLGALKVAKVQPIDMEFQRISNDGRKAKRKATSAQDFVGTYQWSGANQLSQEIFPNEGVMKIVIDETDPKKIYVTGFNSVVDGEGYIDEGTLTAEFDESTGRLYIRNQFTFYSDTYDQNVNFVNWTVRNPVGDEDPKAYYLLEAPESNPFYFSLTEYGIRAGDRDKDKWDNHEYTDEELKDLTCIASSYVVDTGYFWMCNSVAGEVLHEFDFIADQWQLLGDAELTDAWFPVFWQDGLTPTYSVPLYSDKTQGGRYLLYDPYGKSTPYGEYDVNIGNKTGHLIFNISDPECVVFEPFIFSATIDMRTYEEDDPDPVDFYCFNLEGYYYYLQASSPDEIIINMIQNGKDVSTLDITRNEVIIHNAVFSMGLSSTYYSWGQQYDMSGSIVLPDNYMDGVESVLGEDANAPAVYYNLQGQRVNNPEKGQLLIVKKGNKTSKQIIR